MRSILEDRNNDSVTVFDKHVQTKRIQMLKAAIPYINTSSQRALSMYVKAIELINTMNFFNSEENQMKICSVDDENKLINMLTDIKPFCNDAETETVDSILNIITTINLYFDAKEAE